ARQAKGFFQIERRDDLAIDDGLLEVRRVLLDDVEAAIGKLVFRLVVPGAGLELVRSVLHKHRQEVLAGRGHRRIERRRHRTLDYRVARRDAILGVVVTALDEVLIGTEVHGAVMLRADAGTGHGGEVWRLGQRDVDLHGGAFVADAFDRGEEVGREVFWFEEFLKGPVRIDAAGDLGGLEFFATRQGDA